MPNIRELLDKNKLVLYLIIIISAFGFFSVVHQEPRVSIKPITESKMTQLEKLARDNQELKERLSKLEPASPVKIIRAQQPSSNIYDLSVVDVLVDGSRIPFTKVYEDPTWIRPDYQPYWHSKPGIWSNIPDRIHNSYHRLFVTIGSNSLWDEALHDSGLVEIADKFKLPVYDDREENTVAIVALQHHITDIVMFKNQIVLLGTPTRTGVQIIAVDKRDLSSNASGEVLAQNTSQEYLLQLSTPDGYEIDYNTVTIPY